MTLENEKRFLLLLSSFALGGKATKEAVLDNIEYRDWIVLLPKDVELRQGRAEAIWRNDLAFVRKHLEIEGLFVSGIRDDWSITEKGESYLLALYEMMQKEVALRKVNKKAVQDAQIMLSGKSVEWLLASGDFLEGRASYKLHLVRERNRDLINQAKAKFKQEHNGRLYCEICGFDFYSCYGDRGSDYIEAHHNKPISEMEENQSTSIDDLTMLCSNCHSMIHRSRPWLEVDQLKKLVKQ